MCTAGLCLQESAFLQGRRGAETWSLPAGWRGGSQQETGPIASALPSSQQCRGGLIFVRFLSDLSDGKAPRCEIASASADSWQCAERAARGAAEGGTWGTRRGRAGLWGVQPALKCACGTPRGLGAAVKKQSALSYSFSFPSSPLLLVAFWGDRAPSHIRRRSAGTLPDRAAPWGSRNGVPGRCGAARHRSNRKTPKQIGLCLAHQLLALLSILHTAGIRAVHEEQHEVPGCLSKAKRCTQHPCP